MDLSRDVIKAGLTSGAANGKVVAMFLTEQTKQSYGTTSDGKVALTGFDCQTCQRNYCMT